MAVESLFDRGELADWREFVGALKRDTELAKSALKLAEGHEDRGSASLVRILIARHHPSLIDDSLVR